MYRYAGLWKIETGRDDPSTPALLYPTPETWTNEWKWHGLFALESMGAIKTNAGVNVRLLSGGAQIEAIPATMQEIVQHLASLSGGGRARVLVTADASAPHSSLMTVLEICKKYAIDVLFLEHWEAEQAAPPQSQPAARYPQR